MIKKCLFLVAGLGTRFLPATKAMPKEMMPVLDKPLVQYGVEEALNADMSEICFVTGRNKRAIEDHFDDNLELDFHVKDTVREEALSGIRELMSKCSFSYTRQAQMLGPGHAVKLGQILTGDEPFGVVLADDLCFGAERNVLQQLLDVYQKYRCSIVAVQEVPREVSDRYGIVVGEFLEDGVVDVKSLVEKPAPSDAPSNLGIVGRYILTPDIYDALEQIEPGVSGEYQLTDAIDLLAKEQRVLACRFQGKRFDCGSLDGFVAATNYCYRTRFGKLPIPEC
ncbi:MAG: UTP--glucose-1-phosphate uridylyltransferase GalU [Gammaproteobacteria bacterium]|nr:UTP--glucose-1-phosphate uridylyltransferase GalU [Gammaproteobacteria bacterium]